MGAGMGSRIGFGTGGERWDEREDRFEEQGAALERGRGLVWGALGGAGARGRLDLRAGISACRASACRWSAVEVFAGEPRLELLPGA